MQLAQQLWQCNLSLFLFESNYLFFISQILRIGYSYIAYNVMVTNPNTLTQIDSMDLTVPVKQDYLKYLSLQFPSVVETDILPASLIVSTTKSTTTTTTITTGATYSASTNLLTYVEQNNQQSLVSYFETYTFKSIVYLKDFF